MRPWTFIAITLAAYLGGATAGFYDGSHKKPPTGPRVTIRAGASICEDVPQFADCFTADYPVAVTVVSRDSVAAHVRTADNRYTVNPGDLITQ